MCFFCMKAGNIKKCSKYAVQRVKQGEHINFVCREVNLDLVPNDTWWIDLGTASYISITMQECLRSQVPIDGEKCIYTGNDNKDVVDAISVFKIPLYTGFYLDMGETFVVLSFKQN